MASEKLEPIFGRLLIAWKNESWEQARDLLNQICKAMAIEAFEQTLLLDLEAAKGIAGLFENTKLSDAPKESAAYICYFRTMGCIIRHKLLSFYPPQASLPGRTIH